MDSSTTSALAAYRFVDLVTYRRDGRAVSTPVLFVPHGQRLLVRISRRSGKFRRLQHSDLVEIAGCDSRGRRLADGVAGHARILDHDAVAPALRSLHRRYPIAGRLFTAFRWLRCEPDVILEVEPRG